jgi:inosine-uridine nucleoside N-ribohydrolase
MARSRRITSAVGALVGAGVLVLSGLSSGSAAAQARDPVRLIIDTDIFTNADDVGALAIANTLQDQGAVRLLGVIVSSPSRWGAGAVDAINTYYGHGDVPVGALKPTDDRVAPRNYAQPLAQQFPHDLADGTQAPEAVALYRTLLAAQPDRSVVVAAIGMETNLARLLDSPADATSPLTGAQLVAAKVAKLVMMGGRYPQGSESNFTRDPGAAERAVNNWPTPIVFSGYEIGAEIMTGSKLADTPATNPVRRAYEIFAGAGVDRPSWDQSALYVAGKGIDGVFGLSAAGRNTVGPDGANTGKKTADGKQHYLVTSVPAGTVADKLQTSMTQAPRGAAA